MYYIVLSLLHVVLYIVMIERVVKTFEFSPCRLSPEVFLKRPATGTYWRLDKILKRKAVWGKTLLHYIYSFIHFISSLPYLS